MSRKKSISVKVEPVVLKWIVGASGWTADEIVKKLKISLNTFERWLAGELNPTLNQLDALASTLKRPLAAFFLAVPPKELPLPKDYRMLPDRLGTFDKKTVLAIRRARRLQKLSKELSENLNTNTIFITTKLSLSNNPVTVAENYRQEFDFTEEKQQKKLKNSYDVFNYLRDIIEDKNILSFQISMPVEDARGFALVDKSPAIIVVNSKDTIEARIFTLIHEFGHVLLRESGISLPENSLVLKNVESVEKWCNDFASAFLFPESIARRAFTENKSTIIETDTLNKLSRAYKLSKAMILYNMIKFNFISQVQYESVLKRPKTEKAGKKSAGFGSRADKKCLNEKGQKFVSLVLSNVEKGFITHSDALNYLSIKSNNLENVMRKARK